MHIKTLLSSFCLLIASQALAVTINGLNYSLSGTEATVTGAVDKNSTKIVIPASVEYNGKTYNVTTIGKNAFHTCKKVVNLVIEDSDTPIRSVWYTDGNGWQVQSIPFQNSPLKSIYLGRNTSVHQNDKISNDLPLGNAGNHITVTVGGGTTQINTQTFKAVDMKSVTIGGSVENVYTKTFTGQKNLRKVVLSSGTSAINFVDGDAFPDSPLDSVIVHRATFLASPTSNAKGFYNNKNVKNVICGTPSIAKYQFYCPNIETLRILPTCTEVATQTAGPWTLKKLFIDDSDQELTMNMTSNGELDSIYIGRSVPGIDGKYRSKKLETGPLLVDIPNFLCYGHSEIESVTLHKNVRTLGKRAFHDCKKLTSIHLPDGITTIGEEAFCGCAELTSINIPSSLEAIPKAMLKNCKKLNGVLTIPAHIKKIEDNAFENSGYQKLIVTDSPDPLEFGSVSPLYGTNLEYLYMGRQPVKEQSGYNLLSGNIDTLELGSNVTSIISNFGIGYGNTKHLILSENIKTLTHFMFASCSKLETIRCKSEIPASTVGNDDPCISSDNYKNVVVTVPVGTKKTYQADKIWGKFQHIRCDEYIVKVRYNSDGGTVTLNGQDLEELRLAEGEPLKAEAIPAGGYVLDSFLVDGNKVDTDDSTYEIPEIDNDTDIDVSFIPDANTGIKHESCDGIKISVSSGTLKVDAGVTDCMLFDINGNEIYRGSGSFSVILQQGVYIIKTRNDSLKVII